MFRKIIQRAAVLALFGAATACADLEPIGPSLVDDAALTGAADLAFHDGRLALKWVEPVARDIAVTQTFGVWGGVMELGNPGLRLWVPPFAVASDMELTMSARAGEDVAFDFGPHGTNFRTPVWISIDLAQVLDGKLLLEQLRDCAEPEDPSGLVASAKKGKGPKAAGKKKSNKKKKDEADTSSDTAGTSSTSSTDTEDDEASSPDTAATRTYDAPDNLDTCEFSWFEQLPGMEGVYMDPDSKGSVTQVLEDFEVWIFMDRWLTFKTDHFSGYALAM